MSEALSFRQHQSFCQIMHFLGEEKGEGVGWGGKETVSSCKCHSQRLHRPQALEQGVALSLACRIRVLGGVAALCGVKPGVSTTATK